MFYLYTKEKFSKDQIRSFKETLIKHVEQINKNAKALDTKFSIYLSIVETVFKSSFISSLVCFVLVLVFFPSSTACWVLEDTSSLYSGNLVDAVHDRVGIHNLFNFLINFMNILV